MMKTIFSLFVNAALVVFLVFLVPPAAYAVEDCSQIGGKCRQACTPDETIEQGAFIDCTDKEECCVEASEPKKAFRCCIISAEPGNFSASNCIPAVDGKCAKGAGHAPECSSLIYCR